MQLQLVRPAEVCFHRSSSSSACLSHLHFNIPLFQRMDMTSTLMIRVDTLDRFSSEHRVVGYALVAIFMDPSGNQVTRPQV